MTLGSPSLRTRAPTPLRGAGEVRADTTSRALEYPPTTLPRRIAWRYAVSIVVLHLAALLVFVPALFSWTGVVCLCLGMYLFGVVGINLGYHRLLTHRGFTTPLWCERFITLLGLCCLQDTPGRWVATHRLHHQKSDDVEDPHSPLAAFFWSHVGWLLVVDSRLSGVSHFDRYARDILRDPFYLWLERRLRWVWIYLGHALLFFLGGTLAGWWATANWGEGIQLGLSVVVWGVVARTVVTWHIAWSVNSFTHLWGYRSFPTADNSRNNWFVGLVAAGEGWHNNHHADPRCAAHGRRWWEIDCTHRTIRVLEWLGLARDVIRPRPIPAGGAMDDGAM